MYGVQESKHHLSCSVYYVKEGGKLHSIIFRLQAELINTTTALGKENHTLLHFLA